MNLDKNLIFAPPKTKVDNLGKKKYMKDSKMLGKLSKENSALTFEGIQQFVSLFVCPSIIVRAFLHAA